MMTVVHKLCAVSSIVTSVTLTGTEKALSKFSVHDLLPDTENYMTYEGSLTKPGCYETVTWVVMNKPVYVSSSLVRLHYTTQL